MLHFEMMKFGTFDFSQLTFMVWLLIGLALVFDFLNGFHDTANSIATVVSTRVLSPQWAVVWAAFFNFAAFLVFPLAVAATISGGVVDADKIRDPVHGVNDIIAATLIAACVWNLLTWFLALPTSSTHALLGGLIGAALAKTGGLGALLPQGLLLTILFIFVSPLFGFLCGLGMAVVVHWLCRSPIPSRRDILSPLIALMVGGLATWGFWWLVTALLRFLLTPASDAAATDPAMVGLLAAFLAGLAGLTVAWLAWKGLRWIRESPTPQRVDQVFRKGQLLSAAWFSLTHGGNDAQKTMGIIFILLVASLPAVAPGEPAHNPQPFEVVLACHLAIALGTLFGGWRIVKTMGQKIIKLRPVDGFCAENGAGIAVAIATLFGGIPVSTTHTVTGSIVGVGSLKRLSAVRWGVAGRVVWAWVLTIPGAAIVSALSMGLWHLLYWIGKALFGG